MDLFARTAVALTIAFMVATAVSSARISVIGHRGARAELPENTLPSFARAFAVGADAVELDVHETKDGVVVVHHDAEVNFDLCRQTAGAPIAPGTKIFALTYAELQQLDCGAKPSREFPRQQPAPGARVPRLLDVLLLADDHRARVVIELKRGAPDDVPPPLEFARDVMAVVHRAEMGDRVVLQSFDADVMRALRVAAPRAPLAFLFEGNAQGDLVQRTVQAGAQIVAPDVARVDRALVTHAHAVGLQVTPWTVNDPQGWRRLRALGVDGIITDDPRALAAELER